MVNKRFFCIFVINNNLKNKNMRIDFEKLIEITGKYADNEKLGIEYRKLVTKKYGNSGTILTKKYPSDNLNEQLGKEVRELVDSL